MAEAKENDENFKSPLDMIFDEIETGKVYERNPFYQGPSTSSSYADAESDRMAISENTTDEFTWQSSLMERNNDGLSPAREGGLTSDQDFALANYKMFKVAAGKTLKSIIISCNVRMAPMRIEQVRELLKYDEMNLDEMQRIRNIFVHRTIPDIPRTPAVRIPVSRELHIAISPIHGIPFRQGVCTSRTAGNNNNASPIP